MQFPKLTPLQSRFAACLGTSLVLLVIYFSLHPANFAYAAELDSLHHADHNHHRIALARSLALDWGPYEGEGSDDSIGYDPQFEVGALDHGIVGRQSLDTIRLENNKPNNLNIDARETHYYVFEKSQ